MEQSAVPRGRLAPMALGMLVMALLGTRRLQGLRVRPTLALGLATAGMVSAVTGVTQAAEVHPWLAVLLFVFSMAMIASNTAWTFVFFSSIDDRMIGVRTGSSCALFELGSLAGGTVAGALHGSTFHILLCMRTTSALNLVRVCVGRRSDRARGASPETHVWVARRLTKIHIATEI